MGLNLTRTVDASVEPVSTEEMKSHLRVTYSDEDALIDTLTAAARRRIEHITDRALINQTWELRIDWDFPSVIYLPRSPLSSVSSVQYVDNNGDTQTLATSEYTVDATHEPGRIYEAQDKVWPDTWNERNAVIVTFVAGYGAAATDVPDEFKVAMKLLTAHWFRNREASTSLSLSETPEAVQAILAPLTVYLPGS